MTAWDQMTETERDAANECAWEQAASRLRQTIAANPGLDIAAAREIASAAIDADVAEFQRLINRAARARATKADVHAARNCRQYIQERELEQGFMFDVEI